MRVRLDQELCGTTGQCSLLAPDVFQQNDQGVGEVVLANPPEEQRDRVWQAMIGCPVRAIEFDD